MALRVISTRTNYSCECSRGTFQPRKRITIRCFSSTTTIPQKAWRKIFEDEAIRKKIELQDWNKVDIKTLDKKTSELLKKEFKGSMYHALSTLFPEREWTSWKFQERNADLQGFWKEQTNQRKFFDELGKKLGIQNLDDWYEQLSRNVIANNDGGGVLQHNKNCAVTSLLAAYPEHNWMPWKFTYVQYGFWKPIENQRKYFDWLGKELGVEQLDDWYPKLSRDVLKKNGGRTLMKQYNESPIAALMAAYPEHNWIPWKFNNVPRGYWKEQSNQRKFFDYLGKKNGIQTLDDWYQKLSFELVAQHGGIGLVAQYQGSPSSALMAAYPEHNWVPWKFSNTKGLWESQDNIRLFLAQLSEKLSIQTLDDWYRVDWVQLKMFGVGSLLLKYKGLYNLLKEQYPHHPWDPKRFKHGERKGQRWLAVTLKKIFPDEGKTYMSVDC